jgi:hypothetical protein
MGLLRRLFGAESQREVRVSDLAPLNLPPPERPGPADRGETIPDDAIQLPRGAGLAIVGESRRRAEIQAVVGGPHHDAVYETRWARLVREPDNPADPDAIKVLIGGRHVGYLTRGDAQRYRSVVRELEATGPLYCRADIRGGWDRGRGDRGDYGIWLDIGEPGALWDVLAWDLGDGRGDLPADGVALYSGPPCDVDPFPEGIAAMDALTQGPHRYGVRGSAWAQLEAELVEGSRASHILVRIGGRPIGRLARKNRQGVPIDVRAYHRVLRDYAAAGRRGYCRVDVAGGSGDGEGGRLLYRFTVRIDTAERQADLLAAGGRKGKRKT